ncbi:unnamed protein product [Closterium sp. Yama58-4]|nr:unnamed protein product [Closterium sp. Yama58-4]
MILWRALRLETLLGESRDPLPDPLERPYPPPDSLHSDLKGDSRGVVMAAIASNAAVAATSACITAARADTRQAASAPAAARYTSAWKQGGATQQLRSKCHVAPATRRATFRVFAAEGNPAAATEDVTFSWTGPGSEVLLTGDFLNWEVKIPLVKLPNGTFSARQKLPPGRYAYKFIVDGVWQHSPADATISDGAGGFNNTLVIEDPNKNKPEPAPEAPAAPAAAPAAAAPAPKAEGAPAGKKVVGKAVGKAVGKKVVAKAIGLAMSEDVIPALLAALGKEEGVRNVEINFTDNVLCGSFIKNEIPVNFWAYFPDGALDGARGFSLTTYGNPPSTVEPFIIDERKVTPELLVFWITKRLFAQKLLALN